MSVHEKKNRKNLKKNACDRGGGGGGSVDRNNFSLYVADPQLGSFIGAEKLVKWQLFSWPFFCIINKCVHTYIFSESRSWNFCWSEKKII